MADDLSVVNGARVSFARRKDEMDASDEGLIRFLMRDRHGSPFEHNAFRFHVRTPIFVAREWFRHRIGCLTEDAEVTFVDVNGHAHMRKTMGELAGDVGAWRARRPRTQSPSSGRLSVTFMPAGLTQRSIARRLGVGRRGVRSCLAGADGYRDAKRRVRRMRVRVLDEESQEFTTGHIADVIDKGVQPVYRITLADGKQLTLTENHRLRSDAGWVTAREGLGLVGDGEAVRMTRECKLLVNGIPVHQDADVARHPARRGPLRPGDRRRRRLQLPHRSQVAEAA